MLSSKLIYVHNPRRVGAMKSGKSKYNAKDYKSLYCYYRLYTIVPFQKVQQGIAVAWAFQDGRFLGAAWRCAERPK